MRTTTCTQRRQHPGHARPRGAGPERGSMSIETVVIALGLFLLATAVIAAITAWAMGKLSGLA